MIHLLVLSTKCDSATECNESYAEYNFSIKCSSATETNDQSIKWNDVHAIELLNADLMDYYIWFIYLM